MNASSKSWELTRRCWVRFWSRSTSRRSTEKRETVFRLVRNSRLGVEILPVLASTVRDGSYPRWDFVDAIGMARAILKADFGDWYRDLRGKSEEEEREEKEVKEKADRERSHLEFAERREKWLREFTQDEDAKTVHTDAEVKFLTRSLNRIKERIIDMEKSEDWTDFHEVIHTLKYVIKPFDFQSSFRIHRAQMDENTYGLRAIVKGEIALQLEKADLYADR
jgi:hypothetical protein